MSVPPRLSSAFESARSADKSAVKSDLIVESRFPHIECFRFEASASAAVSIWQSLRSRFHETGYWPLLVSNADEFIDNAISTAEAVPTWPAQFRSIQEACSTPEEILAAAEATPFPKWVQQQRDPKRRAEKFRAEADFFEKNCEGSEGIVQLNREMAEAAEQEPPFSFDSSRYERPAEQRIPSQDKPFCLTALDTETWKYIPAEEVTVLLAPVEACWQFPAWLPFGTGQQQVQAQAHVAALKWLIDEFQAEPIGVSDRCLDVKPGSRPTDWEHALRAAVDLHSWSHATASSETEFVQPEDLAVYLMASDYWSLCWP